MPPLLIRHNLSVPDLQSYYTALWSGDQTSFSSSQARGWLTDLEMVGRECVGDTETGWGSVMVHRAVVLPLLPHLAVLSQASGGMGDSDSKVVFAEVPLEVIKAVVQLLYTGQCTLSPVSDVKSIWDMMNSLGLVMQPDRMEVVKGPQKGPEVYSKYIVRRIESGAIGQESVQTQRESLMNETIEDVLRMANRFAEETAKEANGENQDEPDKEKYFECDVCKKVVAKKCNLVRHMMTHQGIKFSCSECDSSYSREEKLVDHQKKKHNYVKEKISELKHARSKSFQGKLRNTTTKELTDESVSTLKCFPVDGNEAVKKSKALVIKDENLNVLQRVVRNKSDEPTFTCEHCDYKFRFYSQLLEHSGAIHKEQMFSCENCDFESKNLLCIKKHKKRVHFGAGKYSCDHCEFKAVSSIKIKWHKKFHHKKSERIEDEDLIDGLKKSKSQKSASTSSINKVIQPRSRIAGRKFNPEGVFHCHVCDFKTMFSKSLERHLKRFHEENW
eukprot:GFUD01023847.1.p1 GENE.GFUD01023847.1~~GFUD01023847.1.p1  ORF type:complete len:501 (+),score=134.00 GFUD01023847.1:149-1651(+)